tara:strand:- start:153 stop:458 length:306 start_codon:yes stop_codon:yes gene_type:complete
VITKKNEPLLTVNEMDIDQSPSIECLDELDVRSANFSPKSSFRINGDVSKNRMANKNNNGDVSMSMMGRENIRRGDTSKNILSNLSLMPPTNFTKIAKKIT